MDNSNIKIDEEKVWLGLYIIILVALGYWLKDFFTLSWQEGLLQNDYNWTLDNISIILSIFAGVYYGILLVTLFKNPFKTVQAILLLSFSVIVTIFYIHRIYDNYDNILFFLISLLLSSQYARKQEVPTCNYGTISIKQILESDKPLTLTIDKLKEPLTIVLCLTSFIIISSMINYLAGYYSKSQAFPDGTGVFIAGTGFFISIFYIFMNYEIDHEKVFVLGPPRVGKTVFIGTLCVRAGGIPNDMLNKKLNEMINQWPKPTNAPDDIIFTFKKGEYFAKCIKISTVDYPGGMILEGIYETFIALQEKKEKLNPPSFSNLIDRIDLEKEIPNRYKSQEDSIKKIILNIKDSKKIIYLISATSFRQDSDMALYHPDISKIDNYIKIYELIAIVTDIPVMIVVNKIDKEYASQLKTNTNVTSDDVAKWIFDDLIKTCNISLLRKQRAIIRSDSQTNDEISRIFPCWVNGDDEKPSIKNGSIDGVGYDAIIKQL
ncbi:MAG: hypothetical protein Q8P40_03050 [Nitrospirota bacterium]|nr:hypothetical protein [Nitrospirota bacterium]